MITDAVIQEIYKKNRKPPKDLNDLNLPEVLYILRQHHDMTVDSEDLTKAEVVLNDMEEYSPFRRFLVRSLHAILHFDRQVAFVFRSHILFLNKNNSELRVHFRTEEDEEDDDDDDRNWLARLFGRQHR